MNKITAITATNALFIFTLLFAMSVLAKESGKDTDIVCFAAQNKWICAPKDQQEIAQEKASKLIKEKNKLNSQKEDVVVNPLNIPKMEAIDYSAQPEEVELSSSTILETKSVEPLSKKQSLSPNSPKEIDDYAKFRS
jgi:hypothetical protein